MPTMDIFAFSGDMLLTVAGAALACVVLTQWAKHYLPDWRYTNLLALALTVALCETAVALYTSRAVSDFFDGLLWALLGASLATFGYEAITNLLGIAGIGPRK